MSVDITISARDKVSQTMDAITRSVEELNKALEEVQEQSGHTGNSMQNAFDRIQSNVGKVGKGFQTVGRGLTKYITKPALATAGALAGITLKKGFSRMQQLDEARAKIKAMGADYDAIKNAALAATKDTAFALNEAMTAGASAAAAGVKNADMPKYMSAVADTAAVAGVSFDEMGQVFNKVMANGKMSAEEWNMMTDRGVDVFGALRKATGKTNEELLEMRKNGEITSDVFLDAFANAYEKVDGKTLAQQIGSSTISGAFANINASLARIGAGFLGDTEDANTFAGKLLNLMKSVQGALGKVEDKAASLGEAFGKLAGPYMEKMTNFFDGIANGSVKIDVAKAKMAGIATLAATALGPALTIAGKAMLLFSEHGGKLKTIAGMFKKIGPNVLKIGGPIALIATGILMAWKNSEKFRNSAGNLFSTLWESLQTVASALAPVFQSLLEIVGPVMGAIGDLMAPLVDIMAQMAAGMAQKIAAVATAITPIAQSIADTVSKVSDKIEAMGGAWEAIKTAGKTLTVKVAGGAKAALDAIKKAWDKIKAKAKSLTVKVLGGAKAVLEAIKTAWDAIRSATKNYTVKVLGGAAGALGAIKSAWGAISSGTKTLKVITKKITEKITRKGKDEGATGIKSSKGGPTLVGERGPEILDLPKGASVHTARKTEAVMKGLAATQLPVPLQMPQFQMLQPQQTAQIQIPALANLAAQVGKPQMPQQDLVNPPVIQQQTPAPQPSNKNLSFNVNMTNNMAEKGKTIEEIISELSKRLEEVLTSSAEGVVE